MYGIEDFSPTMLPQNVPATHCCQSRPNSLQASIEDDPAGLIQLAPPQDWQTLWWLLNVPSGQRSQSGSPEPRSRRDARAGEVSGAGQPSAPLWPLLLLLLQYSRHPERTRRAFRLFLLLSVGVGVGVELLLMVNGVGTVQAMPTAGATEWGSLDGCAAQGSYEQGHQGYRGQPSWLAACCCWSC